MGKTPKSMALHSHVQIWLAIIVFIGLTYVTHICTSQSRYYQNVVLLCAGGNFRNFKGKIELKLIPPIWMLNPSVFAA